jgi:hypothetical protein
MEDIIERTLDGQVTDISFELVSAKAAVSAHPFNAGKKGRDLLDAQFAAAEKESLSRLAEDRFKSVRSMQIIITAQSSSFEVLAEALASRQWAKLASLEISCANYSALDRANEFDWTNGQFLVPSELAEKMWNAMPALKQLHLVGDFIFPEIKHAALETVTLEGFLPIAEFGVPGFFSIKGGLKLPAVHTIDYRIHNSSEGCGPPIDARFIDFSPKIFPALQTLKLNKSDVGDEEGAGTIFEIMAKRPVLKQLKSLALPVIETRDWKKFVSLSKRFLHLSEFTAGGIYFQEEAFDDTDKLLISKVNKLLPNLRLTSGNSS